MENSASPSVPSTPDASAMESATPLAANDIVATARVADKSNETEYCEYSVLLFGGLREAVGAEKIAFRVAENEVESGITIEHLRALCSENFPQLARWMPYVAVAVNCEYSQPQTRIFPRDEIALLPPVAGGSGNEVENAAPFPRAAISENALDENALRLALEREALGTAGAMIFFVGVVRENARDNEGKSRDVEALEYSAYLPMAFGALEKIIGEVRARYDAVCFIHHRVGKLEIGQASVVIGVASAHRDAAFEGCRYAIESLKRDVPIWKKEFARDGSYWVAGPPREYSQAPSESEAVTT